MKAALLIFAFGLTPAVAQGPKPMGSVATADADVTSGAAGTMSVSGGRALLIGNSSVTAKGRTAEVSLTRGGGVRVCQSSGLHVTDAGDDALMLALDRGALEIRMKSTPRDVVLTPDLRITPALTGMLDLQMRVTRNGDTCIENRGHKAPFLKVKDAFGETEYVIKPGQHVFFEHGSLREVIDRETTPCGCPPEERAVPLAEAALRGGTVTPKQAAAANPFPTAISEGLAQPEPRTPDTPGEVHTQVAGTLTYDPTVKAAAPVPEPPPLAATPAEPAPAPEKGGPFRAVGRFFKRIFVR